MEKPADGAGKRRRLRRVVPWVLLAACVSAVAVIVGTAFLSPYGVISRPVTGLLHEVAPGSVMDAGTQHVLLLGIDARDNEPARADTIVLTRISSEGLGMLSIPRDTRTEVPGHGQDKINHSFAYGGPEMTRQAVAGLTGVDAPNYLVLRMEGVKEIVDAMGGVRVDVPQEMTGKVLGEEREITLRPGPQLLNGDEALVYVRWRWDESGDIGRVKRQQDLLTEILGQALSPSRLANLPELRSAVLENVETNMSKTELLQLAGRVRVLKDSETPMLVGTVPGRAEMMYSPQMDAELSYWVPDRLGLQEVVEDTVR